MGRQFLNSFLMFLLLVAFSTRVAAPRQMEFLDRGLVAVKVSG